MGQIANQMAIDIICKVTDKIKKKIKKAKEQKVDKDKQ